MKRIALSYIDPDPDRARLHRDFVESVNTMAGTVVETSTPAAKNTEFAVVHGLGKVPAEYQVIMQDSDGRLLRSSPQKWTDRVAYFTFTGDGGASARLKVRFR